MKTVHPRLDSGCAGCDSWRIFWTKYDGLYPSHSLLLLFFHCHVMQRTSKNCVGKQSYIVFDNEMNERKPIHFGVAYCAICSPI